MESDDRPNLPYEIIHWVPLATIKCNCRPNTLTILYIFGIGNITNCAHCNTGYQATGIDSHGRLLVAHIPAIITPSGLRPF